MLWNPYQKCGKYVEINQGTNILRILRKNKCSKNILKLEHVFLGAWPGG